MCGIVGLQYYSQLESQRRSRDVLLSMAAKLLHRGPDDLGIYAQGDIGLAHRRLSILDLATGGQPMRTESDNIVIVFNGEIFNYIELRSALKKKGRPFRTNSDTEVIIQLYEEYGLKFVEHLNGQFAIGIWDSKKRRLVLARDRVGICPLYYVHDQGRLFFASEIKALVPAMSGSLEIDPHALDQIFTFWSPVSPRTIFKNVKELSPGTMLVSENGTVKLTRYWDWKFPDGEFLMDPVEDIAASLRDLLVDATSIRLRSDVPVGAYLSGGLDSSVLVRIMHELNTTRLRTFSLTFDDANFDERSYQALLIEQLDLVHSELAVNRDRLALNLVETIWHTESPILRTAPIPMGMLSALVRESGFKVVLTGEGADEVLGGYDLFKEAKVRQFWSKNPASNMRPLLLKRLYPYLKLPKAGQGDYLKSFFGEALEQTNLVHYSHMPRWSTTSYGKKFFSRELSDSLADSALDSMMESLPAAISEKHLFNRAQFIEAKSLMAGYLLSSQGDRMLMKNSVEGRFPYLDHRVIEYANRIPPKYKMWGLNEKFILKKAFGSEIPKEILSRNKQPYRAPDVVPMRGQKLAAGLDQYIRPCALEKTGLFDPIKVNMLIRKAASNQALNVSDSQALTGILTTQILHNLFCD